MTKFMAPICPDQSNHPLRKIQAMPSHKWVGLIADDQARLANKCGLDRTPEGCRSPLDSTDHSTVGDSCDRNSLIQPERPIPPAKMGKITVEVHLKSPRE